MIANRQITMQIPNDIFIALNTNETELVNNIKINYAIQLYFSEKLTIGKAAEFAGMSRYLFETTLAQRNIPVSNLNYQDILNDVDKLNKFAK